jgi:hypothetical protein
VDLDVKEPEIFLDLLPVEKPGQPQKCSMACPLPTDPIIPSSIPATLSDVAVKQYSTAQPIAIAPIQSRVKTVACHGRSSSDES